MPGNTKAIVKDVNGQAAPQYFNPAKDAYEYAQGSNGAIDVQLTGSNVEKKLSIKAVTKTRVAGLNGGLQYDGGPTTVAKIQPESTKQVVNVSGAGEGIVLRLVTDTKDLYSVGVVLNMDDSILLDTNSVSPNGRFSNIATFNRLGMTNQGDEIGFARVVLWDEDAKVYILEYDLSRLGTFQDNFKVEVSNGSDEERAITAVVYYKILSSPEIVVITKNELDPKHIRQMLAEKFGDKEDFTVVAELVQEEDRPDKFKYTVFYRNDVAKETVENYVESILN